MEIYYRQYTNYIPEYALVRRNATVLVTVRTINNVSVSVKPGPDATTYRTVKQLCMSFLLNVQISLQFSVLVIAIMEEEIDG